MIGLHHHHMSYSPAAAAQAGKQRSRRRDQQAIKTHGPGQQAGGQTAPMLHCAPVAPVAPAADSVGGRKGRRLQAAQFVQVPAQTHAGLAGATMLLLVSPCRKSRAHPSDEASRLAPGQQRALPHLRPHSGPPGDRVLLIVNDDHERGGGVPMIGRRLASKSMSSSRQAADQQSQQQQQQQVAGGQLVLGRRSHRLMQQAAERRLQQPLTIELPSAVAAASAAAGPVLDCCAASAGPEAACCPCCCSCCPAPPSTAGQQRQAAHSQRPSRASRTSGLLADAGAELACQPPAMKQKARRQAVQLQQQLAQQLRARSCTGQRRPTGAQVKPRARSPPASQPAVNQMYESLAAELKAKLGDPRAAPILLPPRDYDTLSRRQGKLAGIELRRSTNPQLVGPAPVASPAQVGKDDGQLEEDDYEDDHDQPDSARSSARSSERLEAEQTASSCGRRSRSNSSSGLGSISLGARSSPSAVSSANDESLDDACTASASPAARQQQVVGAQPCPLAPRGKGIENHNPSNVSNGILWNGRVEIPLKINSERRSGGQTYLATKQIIY